MNGTSCMGMQPSHFRSLEVSAVGATLRDNTSARESCEIIGFRSCKRFDLIGTRKQIEVVAKVLTRQGRLPGNNLFVAQKVHQIEINEVPFLRLTANTRVKKKFVVTCYRDVAWRERREDRPQLAC